MKNTYFKELDPFRIERELVNKIDILSRASGEWLQSCQMSDHFTCHTIWDLTALRGTEIHKYVCVCSVYRVCTRLAPSRLLLHVREN